MKRTVEIVLSVLGVITSLVMVGTGVVFYTSRIMRLFYNI